VDQEDQGDHNPPWWTRGGFYILLMYTEAGAKLALAIPGNSLPGHVEADISRPETA